MCCVQFMLYCDICSISFLLSIYFPYICKWTANKVFWLSIINSSAETWLLKTVDIFLYHDLRWVYYAIPPNAMTHENWIWWMVEEAVVPCFKIWHSSGRTWEMLRKFCDCVSHNWIQKLPNVTHTCYHKLGTH